MHGLRDEVYSFDPSLPLEEGWTPPASWYTTGAFDQLERTAVFRRTWQLACRADQVQNPGDYVAGLSFGLAWVVVRGEDGVLRALANVCRHKATQVCEGAGNLPHLTCPYHGWTYRLDGSLKSAPRVAGIRNLVRGEMSLPAFSVEEWGPYVFLNADPEAAPLRGPLAELDSALEKTNWRSLKFHSRRQYVVESNWKVFCDNYLDGGYHIAHMHPSLAAQLDLDSYRTELFDRFSVQTSGGDTVSGGRIGGGAIYAWIYPNLMLNRYGPVLDTNYVIPIDADHCAVTFDFFFDETVDEAWIERSLAQSDVTQREDMWVSAKAQIGMKSGSWPRGRYAPAVEKAVQHFHRLLASDLRGAVR
jgi:choline monooxygenase